MIRNRDTSKWHSGGTIANNIVCVPDIPGNENTGPSPPFKSGHSGTEWEEVCIAKEAGIKFEV